VIHFSQNGDTPSVKWKGSLVSKWGVVQDSTITIISRQIKNKPLL